MWKMAIDKRVCVCVCFAASRQTPRRTPATPKSGRTEGTPKTTPKSARMSALSCIFASYVYTVSQKIAVISLITQK